MLNYSEKSWLHPSDLPDPGSKVLSKLKNSISVFSRSGGTGCFSLPVEIIVIYCDCPASTDTHIKSVIIKRPLQLLDDFPVRENCALVWIKGHIQICKVYGGFPQQRQIPVCEQENPGLVHIYKPHCHYHWCSISYDNYHYAFSFNRADICLIHVEGCQVGLWCTCWN